MLYIGNLIEKLQFYFTFAFVPKALVTGILVALCSALVGVPLVLKRFSFIGDGLSHAAFGALTVASVLKLSNNMFLVLPVTILISIILFQTGNSRKSNGDAAVAMVSSGALGLGYLFMNRFSKSSNISADVCGILFGSTSILTLRTSEVILSVILAAGVTVLFIVFYNRIFSVTFDEGFSRSAGTNTRLYNIFAASLIAIIIVLSMNLAGSLLISALLIFPPLAAMRICTSFKAVTISSAIISVICAAGGILTAILSGTPVGSTIVAWDVAAFLICLLIGVFTK